MNQSQEIVYLRELISVADDKRAVLLLLKSNPKLFCSKNALFYYAALFKRDKILIAMFRLAEKLIERGYLSHEVLLRQMQLVDEGGRNILHLVACTNSPQAFDYCIQHGAPLYNEAYQLYRDSEGRSVVEYAVEENCLAILRYLHKQGVDVNAADQLDRTPLHRFAWIKTLQKTAAFLLLHGANVNAEDLHGNTPLKLILSHFVAGGFYLDKQAVSKALFLLKAGADWRGFSPEDLAALKQILSTQVTETANSKKSSFKYAVRRTELKRLLKWLP